MSAVRRFGLILLLGLTNTAVAAAVGFDVNGVRLGMTQAELQTQLGKKVVCTDRPPSETDPSQASCVNAAFNGKTLPDVFAGQKTLIRYHVLDGRVARISFLGFPSMAFDLIVQAMEPTYGKAAIESQEAQVKRHTKLVNKRATWRNDAGDVIIFDKYSPGNINHSFLNFYSEPYLKLKSADR